MKKLLINAALLLITLSTLIPVASAVVTETANGVTISNTIVSNSAIVNTIPTTTNIPVWFHAYSHNNGSSVHTQRDIYLLANSTTFDWSPPATNYALGVPEGHNDYSSRSSWVEYRRTDIHRPEQLNGNWRFPAYWYDMPSELVGTQYYTAAGYFNYFNDDGYVSFRSLSQYLSSCINILAPKVLPMYSLTATVNFGTSLTYPENVVNPDLTRHFPNYKKFIFSNVNFNPTTLYLECVPSGATYNNVFKGNVIIQSSPLVYCSVGSIESLSFRGCGGANASFNGTLSRNLEVQNSNMTNFNLTLNNRATVSYAGANFSGQSTLSGTIGDLTITDSNVGNGSFSAVTGSANLSRVSF